MKRMVLILALVVIVSSAVLAQNLETVYVSAKGSENNSGRSEAEPIPFFVALQKVMMENTKKIIIIGTMDINSNGVEKTRGEDCLFLVDDFTGTLAKRDPPLGEVVITGKPNAIGTERAVFSAKSSGKIVVMVSKLKIRFEHIEILGGESEHGYGLYIFPGAQVTLGLGAVVRNNSKSGIFIEDGGTCIIDGGEVNNNNGPGIVSLGVLTLRNGSIRDNNSTGNAGGVFIGDGHFTMSGGNITGNRTGTSHGGGGVYVAGDGRFTMTSGSITNNRAQWVGGGVFVRKGGRFDQNGGTVSGNFAREGSDRNVFRE